MREAVVALLDTWSGITALTGRAEFNIVPASEGVVPDPDAASDDSIVEWRSALPMLVYTVGSGSANGPRQERVNVLIEAFAMLEADCHKLLDAVKDRLDARQFAAMAAPLDCIPESPPVRIPAPYDGRLGVSRVDLDYTFLVFA